MRLGEDEILDAPRVMRVQYRVKILVWEAS